jgi:hypothetical protein
MQIEFVNRSREISALNDSRRQLGKQKSTVFINGVSGVGKSQLTERFISICHEFAPAVKVKISQAEKNAYSTGYYINKIASALNESSKIDDRLLSFEQYLRRNRPSGVVLRKIGESFKTDLSSNIPGGNTIKTIFDFFSGQNDFDVDSVFTSTHSEPQFLLAEYIRSECKRSSLVINIENIQSIDPFSLEQLVRIMAESNNCLFLLEFTQDDATGFTISEIINHVESGKINCKILDVLPLSLDDVKKIIQENPEISWELIQRSYVEWKGNLRPLVDILARIKYGISIGTKAELNLISGTKEHLKSLPKNELLLLYVIYWHKEPTEINMLSRLVAFNESFPILYDIHNTIDNLKSKALIICSDQDVLLAHDSIANELKDLPEHSLFTLIAQRFWIKTYNELLDQSDLYLSKGRLLKKVLYYSSCLEDSDRIYELLELISYEALRSRDPAKMISYVLQVKEHLKEQENYQNSSRLKQINLWLIELYYKIGKAKAAWAILQEFELPGKTYVVLKAILLEQIGHHAEAIEYCNNYIPIAENPSQELALRLVKLVTNYDIGNEKETAEEFHFLYRNKKFKNCFEYGFLLRNAELVFTYEESLPYYKKSIAAFTKNNAVRQAAFSQITYGVHLGLTGRYKQAKREFEKANSALGDVISERHTLFNNFAVLNIFQKTSLQEAEDFLKQAMLTAEGDFERLTIHMNFLVIMDWNDRNFDAERAIESINSIIAHHTFASKEILLFAYYDIYKYYENRNREKEAQRYLEKMEEIGIPDQPLWRHWLNNEAMSVDDELYYYGVIDRAISFLCNWNMEYDSALMHYE